MDLLDSYNCRMDPVTAFKKCLKLIPTAERARFNEVFEFSKKHLSPLSRRSGENYFQHGAEVAATLHDTQPDLSLCRVLLLHDLLVHPNGENLLKKAPLSSEEKRLVRHMHELRRLNIDKDTKDLDFVILEFSQDSRLLLMRMAHRLNDLRHIDRFEDPLKTQILSESLHMYTAIAGRLGLHAWRYEMEDLCFRRLYPTLAQKLAQEFEKVKVLDEACLEHTKHYLLKEIRAKNIEATVELRIKSIYSTYRKMVQKKRSFHELTDRLALRIIVNQRDECYPILGIVHRLMHPIPGKLKDYIGAPKENGYRSLHTVVYPLPGVTEQPIEIQIRSWEMDAECEYGVAAHHLYKERTSNLTSNFSRVNLFRNLEILKTEARSPAEFETALLSYFNEDIVLVFDAKNHLYHFKKPATALDFVCLVHGKRCGRLKSVHINGRERSLHTLLHDGDVVDAQFGRQWVYDRKWRSLVQHERSKEVLKQLS